LTGFADKTVLSLIHISRYFSAASKSRHLFAGIGWAKVKNDKTFFNPSPSSQTVEEIVKNSTPEELRRRNRQQLLALGASDQAATDFFDHPDYTPRDDTIIATALGTVKRQPRVVSQGRLPSSHPSGRSLLSEQRLARRHLPAKPSAAAGLSYGRRGSLSFGRERHLDSPLILGLSAMDRIG
jgi:hypothetical protein